jgi:MarR family transcriptional regulator for hemolysin
MASYLKFGMDTPKSRDRSRLRDRSQLEAAFSASLYPLIRSWRRAADRVAQPFGLSSALAWPLLIIGRSGGGIWQTAVADQLAIEGPSLVRLLDQLCATDFVVRRADGTDRRAKTLYLTEKGADLARQLEGALADFRREVLREVSDEDLQSCMRVFAAIDATVGNGQQGNGT